MTERSITIVPIADVLKQLPGSVDWALFSMSVLLLLYLAFRPGNKVVQVTLIFVEILSCCLDQLRWQPWEYQYLFVIFIVVINKDKNILPMILFMAACLYFYSGLHKFNPDFLLQIWQKMILQDFFHLNIQLTQQPIIYFGGYAIAAIELIAGLGLLLKKTRTIAAILLIGVHLLVLILLGPLGLQYNLIIWPWNIALILFLMIFIFTNPAIIFSWKIVFYKWNKIVFIFIGVLPVLYSWGYWDGFLSGSVYSGSEPKAFICIADSSQLSLPKNYYLPDKTNKCNSMPMISLQRWAMQEMNVPVIPQMRVFKKIEADFIKKHPRAGAVFLYY